LEDSEGEKQLWKWLPPQDRFIRLEL